jgi:hypothetical protein
MATTAFSLYFHNAVAKRKNEGPTTRAVGPSVFTFIAFE